MELGYIIGPILVAGGIAAVWFLGKWHEPDMWGDTHQWIRDKRMAEWLSKRDERL